MQRLSQDEVFVQDEVSYSFIDIVILCGRIILRQPVFIVLSSERSIYVCLYLATAAKSYKRNYQ